MERLHSPQTLEAWRNSIRRSIDPDRPRLRVCGGTGCRSLGGPKLLEALKHALDAAGLKGHYWSK